MAFHCFLRVEKETFLMTVLCVEQRYHLNHHFRVQSEGFGITSPLWDRAFGTYPTTKPIQKHKWSCWLHKYYVITRFMYWVGSSFFLFSFCFLYIEHEINASTTIVYFLGDNLPCLNTPIVLSSLWLSDAVSYFHVH